jgi:hypothetical protein
MGLLPRITRRVAQQSLRRDLTVELWSQDRAPPSFDLVTDFLRRTSRAKNKNFVSLKESLQLT